MTVDVATTRAHLRRLEEERAARGAARRRELEAQLPEARDALREKGATRVWVFGSVATGETTSSSDLDLAVEGLPGRQYFPALGELFRRLTCDVNLVRMEEAPESLRERVLAEGREL